MPRLRSRVIEFPGAVPSWRATGREIVAATICRRNSSGAANGKWASSPVLFRFYISGLSFCLRFGFRRNAGWRINAGSPISYHLITRLRAECHFRQCDETRVTVVEHRRKISWHGVNVKMVGAERSASLIRWANLTTRGTFIRVIEQRRRLTSGKNISDELTRRVQKGTIYAGAILY